MNTNESQIGVIRSIEDNSVKVILNGRSGCNSCQLKSSCVPNIDECEGITIETENPRKFYVGERVKIIVSLQVKKWAIFLSTVLPCIVMIAAVCIAIAMHFSQAAAAAAGIIGICIYFCFLNYFKNSVKRKSTLKIEKAGE